MAGAIHTERQLAMLASVRLFERRDLTGS
jgi:hypothetical protein